ncbi:hypothetical protein IRZ71_06855 [Flavobacterium sp. ANB]|uniref:hypothetical protein n=1 Tax=unclassified Flavobacterium TaxID=196869 RepID=UPI0012B6C4F1|nr:MULTISPECIES: hypothetical protein [unclassified Flavobacterium]MBF4516053.1 hypothetical protein [Flavobacterium sp. ANB]MTD69055.1 hypothetical protein [Flavobacterium sp. LC2016-13]
MFTTTIVDEKGIRYLNKFNGFVVKDLPWSSFAKKEDFTYLLESPKYDVSSNTPMKSVFDQFAWPVLINKNVVIHTDAFLGRHFFCMFYSNRTELIRSFLLGIARYRPDITVNPAIFVNHNIDMENYIIDYRKRRITQVLGFGVCVFILALSYYFVFH